MIALPSRLLKTRTERLISLMDDQGSVQMVFLEIDNMPLGWRKQGCPKQQESKVILADTPASGLLMGIRSVCIERNKVGSPFL